MRSHGNATIVEELKGNLFKTRIYPLPAKGTRTIKIQYTHSLSSGKDGNGYINYIPFDETKHRSLADLSVNVCISSYLREISSDDSILNEPAVLIQTHSGDLIYYRSYSDENSTESTSVKSKTSKTFQ